MTTKNTKQNKANIPQNDKPETTPIPPVSVPLLSAGVPAPVQTNSLEVGPLSIIPPEVIQQLNAQISEKLKTAEIVKKKHEKDAEDFKPLEAIVAEYLQSFLILGYTIDGHKILIGHAPTPHDHDALVEHLRQTFIRTINE